MSYEGGEKVVTKTRLLRGVLLTEDNTAMDLC